MPFIKRLKPGKFASLDGDEAYDYIEVDNYGNPIQEGRQPRPKKQTIKKSDYVSPGSLTEEKIAPGIRAPDVRKGYKTPFDYHQWNSIRKKR